MGDFLLLSKKPNINNKTIQQEKYNWSLEPEIE